MTKPYSGGPKGTGAPRRVDKPWGHELIWAETGAYVGKILHLEAGRRLSLQYHEVKEETLLVLTGSLRVLLDDDDGSLTERICGPQDVIHVAPRRRHRFHAITDCDLVEVSTTELDDVVRLSDDYGRAPRGDDGV